MLIFNKKNCLTLALALIVIATLALYFFIRNSQATDLVINEISFAHNQKNDWIEIYNPTLNSLTLKGLYLTDTQKNYRRFVIKQNIIIPSHGFIVLYGKSHDAAPEHSPTLNFNITRGETVYLTSESGHEIIDHITALTPLSASNNFSVGRFPDGSNDVFILQNITPGAKNIDN